MESTLQNSVTTNNKRINGFIGKIINWLLVIVGFVAVLPVNASVISTAELTANGEPSRVESYSLIPGPNIISIVRTSAEESTATEVSFLVTFSGPASGLTASNFQIYNTNTLQGTITSVTGTDGDASATWTVTVSNITGNGELSMIMRDAANTNVSANGLPYMDSETYSFPLPPEVTTGGVLSALNTVQGTASSATSFTVSGSSLKSSIVIRPPANFEVRQLPANYASFTTVSTGGEKTIYIRLKASAPVGTHSGDIVITSTDVDTIKLAMPASTVTAPQVAISSITRVDAEVTHADEVRFTVTFSGSVTGVSASNFNLQRIGSATGTISSVSGSGSTYTVTVNSITGDGILTLQLVNSTNISHTISTTLPFAGQSYIIDNTIPAITFSSPSVVRTKAGPVEYAVTYSEQSTINWNALHLYNNRSVTGTAAVGSLSVNAQGTKITLSSFTGNGTFTFRLPAGVITDAAGNQSAATELAPIVIIDNSGPAITNIVYATTNSDPTKAIPGDVVTMNFTLDEDLLENPVFTIAGVSGHNITRPDCISYTVSRTISASDPLGPITFSAALKDLFGNISNINETSTVSISEPSVDISAFTATIVSPTNAENLEYILELPEEITGLTAANFQLVTTGTIADANIGTPVANLNSWSIPVNTGTGEGNITLKLANATGLSKPISNLPYSGPVLTIDKVGPVISNVTFTTSNTDAGQAVEGDTVTLSFTSKEELFPLEGYTDLYMIIGNSWELLENTGGFNYRAVRVLDSSDPTGDINARFQLKDAAGNITEFSETSTINYHKRSDDNTLSNLTIGHGSGITPPFGSVPITQYQSFGLTGGTVLVTPTANSAYASITVNGTTAVSGNGVEVTLANGSNTITIVVTAENGASKTYTILANVMGDPNATLSVLSLENNIPLREATGSDFKNYTATVNRGTTRILATGTHPGASIKINGESVVSGEFSPQIALNMGVNTVNIEVTSNDATVTNVYSIIITRGLSDNALLSQLELEGGIPIKKVGGPNYRDYTATAVTESIRLTASTQDSSATLRINGEEAISGEQTQAIALAYGANTINVEVTAADGATTNTYSIVVTRKLPGNTELSQLELNQGIAKTKTSGPHYRNYKAVTTAATVSVVATAKDSLATVRIGRQQLAGGEYSQPIALEMGTNTINVAVTAQDGTTSIYSIAVTRKASDNAELSQLDLDQGITKTKARGINYRDYTATTALSQVRIIATAKDSTATIKVNGETLISGNYSQPVALTMGANAINVTVTAENGVTTNTYSIVVTRKLSSNALLSQLTLDQGITLKKTKGTNYRDYTATAYSGSVSVTASSQDPSATIKVNGTALSSGSATPPIALNAGINTINVEVTAQDGTTTNTYSIAVTQKASDNALLSSLVLDPAVSRKTVSGINYRDYTATVQADQDTINVLATAHDPQAEIKINGTAVEHGAAYRASLQPGGNTIAVAVTAADGVTTKTYSIVLTRPSTNAGRMQAAVPEITVSAALTPNGDGINDILMISGIESYPDNTLQIMNSKGTQVISIYGYDNQGRIFNGRNQHGAQLPEGTYFYMLQYTIGVDTKTKSGYIILKY
ncbi:hypothetical protein DJ568_07320 [Mucilaginibacter hurinus]|uniref:Cadherin-like beta-sandwich-like domain-containing protein n=1 Tax=Mucilaginibacter hurinus TaxID=2201324 RepID=A0A367GRI4_9SPHI|nr:cadherin-like beta sandwich domain-containing protein [Mucilaginibacter hurinus]RCH55688.1 hypothetical protein DJ568_07320 [Mucilaginibacter hurinus]